MTMTATYSPEDNKLRLYPSSRLPKELYERVRAAGFVWAPKQELFVAPAWTPAREDLLIELCGEIDDDDKSLVERQEERAERFEDYSDKREADAQQAAAAVDRIADGIPLGQPILVGHHSERHARKDAERIENGMRRAVKMWETSKYWTDRAAGAVRHAKYKERPDVRARRIKGLEADERKQAKSKKEAETFLKMWTRDDIALTMDRAKAIANACHASEAFTRAEYPRELPKSQYESPQSVWSVLDDEIISAEQAREICVRGHESVIAWADRWLAHLGNRLAYERAMMGESGGIAADKVKPEKGGACKCWVRRGWIEIVKVNKVSVSVLDNWGNGGADFKRTIPFDKLSAVITKAEYDALKAGAIPIETRRPDDWAQREHAAHTASKPVAQANLFDAMTEALKAGVKVVSAPQLFPTPPDLARRVVELAKVHEGHSILEPSAGTGSIVRAIRNVAPEAVIDAVEISQQLAGVLHLRGPGSVRCADFLALNGELGTFDRIVMNPPFANAQDIRHIEHALTKLKPGGRLVAICANGPRQREKLQPLALEWIDLPAGSFQEAGTNVNAAVLVIDR